MLGEHGFTHGRNSHSQDHRTSFDGHLHCKLRDTRRCCNFLFHLFLLCRAEVRNRPSHRELDGEHGHGCGCWAWLTQVCRLVEVSQISWGKCTSSWCACGWSISESFRGRSFGRCWSPGGRNNGRMSCCWGWGWKHSWMCGWGNGGSKSWDLRRVMCAARWSQGWVRRTRGGGMAGSQCRIGRRHLSRRRWSNSGAE